MGFCRGQIITFSGIDGAGKSTQIDLVIQYLKDAGGNPIYFWTRGGYTGPFNALKSLLRRCTGKKLPPSGRSEQREQVFGKHWVRELWLNAAILDLMLIYGIYLRVLKFLRRVVVADRYLWDTWIDFRLNFPESNVDKRFMWKMLVWVTPIPDKSFLLFIPVQESLRRSKLKNEPFPDSEQTLKSRLGLYENIASLHRWQCLDCFRPIEVIQKQILEALTESARK